MTGINYICLPEATSTNSILASMAPDLPHASVIYTHRQTAGRGQRGNSWESQPGMNITLSALIKPHAFPARSQFAISQAVAIAVADTVANLIPNPTDVRIKWPNDIYIADRKVAGILIENSLSGNSIRHSIAGIGLNVNQTKFTSDAPNPISIRQLTDINHPLDNVLHMLSQNIFSLIDSHISTARLSDLHTHFLSRLWRADGPPHPFRISATGRIVNARIHTVDPLGPIILQFPDNTLHTFAFKEISFIL